MKILVTGAAGFVASHICDRLLADGHEVLGVDNFSSGVDNRPKHERFDFIEEDLRRPDDSFRRIVASVDACVHAAAYAQLRKWTYSEDERRRLVLDNVQATAELLERLPAVPVVYLGTASVYGSRPGQVCVEDDASPETCESWYAATKLTGEYLVSAWAYWRGVPWRVARLVNVVGARSHRGVIADFVRMHRDEGRIHAADDGQQRKSWVHVADVAEAVVRMIGTAPSDEAVARDGAIAAWARYSPVPSGVYNVTSLERWSWWDIVDAMGVDRATVTHEACPVGAVGDPRDLCASPAKLAPWYECKRPVVDGVRQALNSLGWERPRAAKEAS